MQFSPDNAIIVLVLANPTTYKYRVFLGENNKFLLFLEVGLNFLEFREKEGDDLDTNVLDAMFFSQLRLQPAPRGMQKKEGQGFTMIPAAESGEGYFWTYPVNRACSIHVYQMSFRENVHYRYHHPASLTISLSSASVAAPVANVEQAGGNYLVGYFMPDGYHEYTIPKQADMYNIGISLLPEFYEKQLPAFCGQDFSMLPAMAAALDGKAEVPQLEAILRQIAAYTPRGGTSELYYESKIMELLAVLMEWHTLKNNTPTVRCVADSDREAIHRLVHFLQQHYCDHMELQQLSKMCCMSKSKLSYLFRLLYGCTISEFIQNQRIEYAKDLLCNSNYRMSEIARMVGYEQQSSFSGAFKQRTGITPNEFRRKN